MFDQILYTETFDSSLRKLTPGIYAFVVLLTIVELFGFATSRVWLTSRVANVFFVCVVLIAVAMIINTLQSSGKVEVTSEEVRITEDGRTDIFLRKLIKNIRETVIHFGRGYYVSDPVDKGRMISVSVKPSHLLFNFISLSGIVMTVSYLEQPIFVPTKHPAELLRALNTTGAMNGLSSLT